MPENIVGLFLTLGLSIPNLGGFFYMEKEVKAKIKVLGYFELSVNSSVSMKNIMLTEKNGNQANCEYTDLVDLIKDLQDFLDVVDRNFAINPF